MVDYIFYLCVDILIWLAKITGTSYEFINILIFIKLKKMIIDSKIFKIIMILLFIQILTGIVMYYFDFPFATQPIHLLISSLIIGFQVYFYVLLNNNKKYGIKN